MPGGYRHPNKSSPGAHLISAGAAAEKSISNTLNRLPGAGLDQSGYATPLLAIEGMPYTGVDMQRTGCGEAIRPVEHYGICVLDYCF